MLTTSLSLLGRLQQPAAADAWQQFVTLYSPILYDWARRFGLQSADAADLVQDVLTILVRRLRTFAADHDKSFRGWLWTVLRNRYLETRPRYHPVPAETLEHLSAADNVAAWADQFDRAAYLQRLMTLVKPDFAEQTWAAFWAVAVEERAPAEVAQALGVSVNTVYLARFRVLARLRQEADGFMD
jgi:RNA polymerase sigma-70 factor (ECF subfamily)